MRKKTINISWSRAIGLDNLENEYNSYKAENGGIYIITRKWGELCGNPRAEKILYIGKTHRNFLKRIEEHKVKWLSEVRGSIYIRLGIIDQNISNDLLEDIESAIIMECQPQENLQKKKSYTYRSNYLVCIQSMGMGDLIPKTINAKEQQKNIYK